MPRKDFCKKNVASRQQKDNGDSEETTSPARLLQIRGTATEEVIPLTVQQWTV